MKDPSSSLSADPFRIVACSPAYCPIPCPAILRFEIGIKSLMPAVAIPGSAINFSGDIVVVTVVAVHRLNQFSDISTRIENSGTERRFRFDSIAEPVSQFDASFREQPAKL